MERSEESLYSRLGVSPGAPREVIDAAYKALLKKCHPDVASGEVDRHERELVARSLGEAHATLSDARSRSSYDELLAASATRTGVHREPTTPGSIAEHEQPNSSPASTAPRYRPYDDLTYREKRDLRILARHDTQWEGLRRKLVSERDRMGRMPAAWVGLDGANVIPASPRFGRPLAQGFLASFLAGLLALLALRSPVPPRLVDRFDLFGLNPGPFVPGFGASALILAAWTSILVGLWSLLYPMFARLEGGSRRLISLILCSGLFVALVPSLFTVSIAVGCAGLALWVLSYLLKR